MNTLTQCVNNYKRIKKLNHSRTFKLKKQPQILTSVVNVIFKRPKKPNSGKRRVFRGLVFNLKRKDRLTARITSYDFFLRKGDRVLVRGGRANDVPGISYTGIRGVFNFKPHVGRKKRRSFYGNKRPLELITRIPKYLIKAGLKTLMDVSLSGGRVRRVRRQAI